MIRTKVSREHLKGAQKKEKIAYYWYTLLLRSESETKKQDWWGPEEVVRVPDETTKACFEKKNYRVFYMVLVCCLPMYVVMVSPLP